MHNLVKSFDEMVLHLWSEWNIYSSHSRRRSLVEAYYLQDIALLTYRWLWWCIFKFFKSCPLQLLIHANELSVNSHLGTRYSLCNSFSTTNSLVPMFIFQSQNRSEKMLAHNQLWNIHLYLSASILGLTQSILQDEIRPAVFLSVSQ